MGPLKSAKVIIKHVTDGIDEGIAHRLPQKIIDFIPEHHGTTTIQFFYHQALSEASENNTNKKIERKMFQYPGPRPRSKETAVVMIADSLEAAARTVEPGKESFMQLVDQIIENKMKEEQFGESPLTLADLSTVKEVFVDVLLSAYHSRPIYPSMEDTESLEDSATEVKAAKLVKKGSNGAK
jgi:membrane-associated HD superfamily phosphohydrolase